MILSAEEIETILGRDIIIYPFNKKQIRGAAYNLRVGPFIWPHSNSRDSGGTGLPLVPAVEPNGRKFTIPPGELVSVMTQEVVYVSRSICGFFHSKVDMVTKGFSHISTTLDPNWIGPLLITLQNSSRLALPLWEGETFVKLSFHRLVAPTRFDHNNPPGRQDRLDGRFKFPDGLENFLEEPINCNLETLRTTFKSSPAWKEYLDQTTIRSEKRHGWLRFILSTVALFAALSAPIWFEKLFGQKPRDEALAGLLAIAFGAFYVLIETMKSPPWKAN